MAIPCKMDPVATRELPAGYKRVEYIECGKNLNDCLLFVRFPATDKFIINMYIVAIDDSNGSSLFGGQYSSSSGFGLTGARWAVRFNTSSGSDVNIDRYRLFPLTINNITGTLTFDTNSGKVEISYPYLQPKVTRPAAIMRRTNQYDWGAVQGNRFGPTRFYHFKITLEDGSVFMDLIPCVDDKGEACLYNKATGVTMRNGYGASPSQVPTAPLIAGPVVSSISPPPPQSN